MQGRARGGRVRRQRLRGAQRHHELLPIANGVDEDVATLAHRSAARARSVACRCEVERRRTRRRETSEEANGGAATHAANTGHLAKTPKSGHKNGRNVPPCVFFKKRPWGRNSENLGLSVHTDPPLVTGSQGERRGPLPGLGWGLGPTPRPHAGRLGAVR